ncbi:MAG: hypothetical protein JWN04_3492 [Myxococcaceae bacterium]|nr:hypothetical protein [Myxococcaceae bacterium]
MLAVPVIELADGADESAFAIMMAELIRANLTDHPEKNADFQAMSGRVALVAEDADTTITLRFRAGVLTVHSGLFGIPDLVIRGSSESLIDLSRLPHHPRFAFLPDFGSSVARSLARAAYERKLRISGLTVHPALALRLGRVLSIY